MNRNGEYNYLMSTIVGTKDVCENIKKILFDCIGIGSFIRKSVGCYRLEIGGNLQMERFIIWLYNNHNGLYLERKYQKARDFIEERKRFIPKNGLKLSKDHLSDFI